MRILSFDVGIRNLGYCDFEVMHDEISNDSNRSHTIESQNAVRCGNDSEAPPRRDSMKILDWQIINLLEDTTPLCQHTMKNGNTCLRPVTWAVEEGDRILPFACCSNHKILYKPPELVKYPHDGDKTRCQWKSCKLNVTSILREDLPQIESESIPSSALPYEEALPTRFCEKHANRLLHSHKVLYSLKKYKVPTCKKMDPFDLKKTIWKVLDSKTQFLRPDHIVIENQPSIKNPAMKSISETIFNYFICRGIIDKDRSGSDIEVIKYVSASNKLKLAPEAESQQIKKLENQAMKYRKTKHWAINYILELLKDDEPARAFFARHKKKDDLADCFLQGLYYCSTLEYSIGRFDLSPILSIVTDPMTNSIQCIDGDHPL